MSGPQHKTPHGWPQGVYVLWLAALCLLLFLPGLGGRSLWDYQEAQLAQASRYMAQHGSWLTPRMGPTHTLARPPLPVWLAAAALRPVLPEGNDPAQRLEFNQDAAFWLRLPSALVALCTVLMVYFLGRRLWSASAGFWAGAALAGTGLFFAAARMAQPLGLASLCLTLAMWGALAYQDGRRVGWPVFWLGCVLGFWSLGLWGLLLPVLVVVVYGVIAARGDVAGRLLGWRGWLFFLAVAGSWLAAAALADRGFVGLWLGRQVLGAFGVPIHQGFWTWTVLTPASLTPWVFLLPWALIRLWIGPAAEKGRRRQQQPDRSHLILVAWLVVTALAPVIMGQSLPLALLPLLPPLALLLGRPLAEVVDQPPGAASPPVAANCLLALAAGLVLAGPLLLLAVALSPSAALWDVGGPLFLTVALAGAAGLLVYALRGRSWGVAAAPLAVGLLLAMVWGLGSRGLDPARSPGWMLATRPQARLIQVGGYSPGAAFYNGGAWHLQRDELGDLAEEMDPDTPGDWRWASRRDLTGLLGRKGPAWVLLPSGMWPQLRDELKSQAGITLNWVDQRGSWVLAAEGKP